MYQGPFRMFRGAEGVNRFYVVFRSSWLSTFTFSRAPSHIQGPRPDLHFRTLVFNRPSTPSHISRSIHHGTTPLPLPAYPSNTDEQVVGFFQ